MSRESSLKSLQSFKKGVKKQINSLRKSHELQRFASKFNSQKKSLEKKVKNAVQADIKNANKFLDARRKELDSFQKKINSTIKRKIKSTKRS